MNNNNIPEIVAPGGSYSKAMVASKNWAEAVYLGVPFTSLRMRQNKVRTFENLKQTIQELQANWTKAYLTMNIFPRNIDIKVFESVVEQIANIWADAIIFSDPGTYNILKKYVWDTPLHLSTQTNTLNHEAVKFWYDLWVKRIVLARELNIEEIKDIKKNVPGMELEVFVHWAMCMTYSWRCLLWEYFSGRDGNKGECSHVCRYNYKVYLEEEKRPGKLYEVEEDEWGSYIMSSKDLCTIERLDEILPYVDWLKIEWRSKSEFYVWSVVRAYKHVRDAILNWNEIDENIKNLVYEIPHRYYWEWFLFNSIRNAPDSEEASPDYNVQDNIEWSISKEEVENKQWESENDDTSSWLTSMTYDTAWPVKTKSYIWVIYPNWILDDFKQFVPKDNIHIWDKFTLLSENWIENIEVIGLKDKNWNDIQRVHCNMEEVHIKADIYLKGWEVLYY